RELFSGSIRQQHPPSGSIRQQHPLSGSIRQQHPHIIDIRAKLAPIVLNYFYYSAKYKVDMEDIKWILDAIENAGKTAIKEDGTYWRASYTREDKAVVDLLKGYMESMGMETFFDAVGNLHGVIRGSEGDTVMTGSHRDTVRNG